MGFFDFLRRKKPEEAAKIEKELSLEDIKEKIDKDEKNLDDKSAKTEENTKYLLSNLIPQLKENLISLKSVNIEKRKEDERLKNIVMDNVVLYSSSFEKLIEELEKFSLESYSNDYITKINNIFESFTKGTAKSYQRATVLVGAQFEAIEKTFRNFFQEFKDTVKDDFENRKRMEKLIKFGENLNQILEYEKDEERIKIILSELDAEKIQKEKEIAKKEEEIENLKKSDIYKADTWEEERAKEELINLDNEIQELQKKIDMKDLARTHHMHERKHKVIQDFIKDFKGSMEKDERVEFAKIIKESRDIDVDFGEIVSKRENLVNYTSKSELSLRELERDKEIAINAISEIEKRDRVEEKKLDKSKEDRENMAKELKSEAEEFFGTV